MKNQIKKTVVIMLVFAMVFAMAACGKDGGSDKTNELDLSSAEWEEIVEAAKGTTGSIQR